MGGRDVETEVCLRTHQVLHGLENFSVNYFLDLKNKKGGEIKNKLWGPLASSLDVEWPNC